MYGNLALSFQLLYYFKFLRFVGPHVSLTKGVLFFLIIIVFGLFVFLTFGIAFISFSFLNVLLKHDLFMCLLCFLFFFFVFVFFPEKTCGPPPSTDHANLTFDVYGTTWQATYHCLPGFAFLDATNTEPAYRRCFESDGEWPSAPTCG